MDLMPNVHFNKNQLIFEEGYPADSVYLICEGAVQVFKKRKNEHVTLATLRKDSIFGEMAFISDRPRSASVVAIEDAWCYSLHKDTFLHRLKNSDQTITRIFEDLTNTIREISNAAVVVDHGAVQPNPDVTELAKQEKALEKITPQYSYDYLMADKALTKKVEEMDFFMRCLFYSLVKIAYRQPA